MKPMFSFWEIKMFCGLPTRVADFASVRGEGHAQQEGYRVELPLDANAKHDRGHRHGHDVVCQQAESVPATATSRPRSAERRNMKSPTSLEM
jgi:hypothetical protein